MFEPRQARSLAISGQALPMSPSGKPVLIPLRLHGTETLGEPYEYTLEVKTADSPTFRFYQAQALVKSENLIGQEITISIEFEGKGKFNPGMPGESGFGNVGAGTRINLRLTKQ